MNYATVRQNVREGVLKGWARAKLNATILAANAKIIAGDPNTKKILGIAAALALCGVTASACGGGSTESKSKCEGDLCITDVNGGDFTQGDAVQKDCNEDKCSSNPRAGVDTYLDVVLGDDPAAADGSAPPKPDAKPATGKEVQVSGEDAPVSGEDAPATAGDVALVYEDTSEAPKLDTAVAGDGPTPPNEKDSYPVGVDGSQYAGVDTSTQTETSQPQIVEEECGGSTITKMYQIKVGPDATDAAVYVGGTLEDNGIAYMITAIDENPDGTVTIHLEGTTAELKTQLFGTYEVKNEFGGNVTYTQKVVVEAFGTTMGAVPQRVVFDEKDCSSEHVFYGVITGATVFVSLDCEQQTDGTYKATRDAEGNLMMHFDAIDGASWVWDDASLAETQVIGTGTEVMFVTVLVGSPVHGHPNCLYTSAGIELEYSNNNYTWILAEGASTGILTTDGKTITVSVLHAIPKDGAIASTGVPTEYVGCATLSVKTPFGDFSQTQCSFDEGAFSQSFGPFGDAVTSTVQFVKVNQGPKANK